MRTPLRMLLVEDSEDDASLLLRELKLGGYDVTFERVDTPSEMRAAFQAGNWEIVISDFAMPHFTGMDALKLLRTMDTDVPFILVSGTIGEEVAVSALKDGAQDYLMKTNLKRLVAAVRRELREATERKGRQKLERQVQQLHKFEAIGRLAGGIAHDFNNVIGAIMGWAELCQQDTTPGTQAHNRLQKIIDQAGRAGALTSQLLSFARQQILQPKKIDLNAHVLHSTSLLRRVIGENIQITVETSPELFVTVADPTQIDQVIMNLCLNARDAMPDGGELTLRTTNIEIGEEYCRLVGYASPGGYVLLSVTDTGIGMAPETIEQIFEPFFTTKEIGKGTGLGLATVYGIVKQHGGFINVESEPGKGTTFRVHFRGSVGTSDLSESKKDDRPLNGTETILLAEDHDGLRESAQQMLETLGYRVLLASDGFEALRLFEAHAGQIDLAVLDVVMPGISGPDLYTQMVSIRPDLRVVFTTGYTNKTASLTTLLEKGAVFLQKPYGQRSFGQTIRETLDQKKLPSSI